MAQSLTTLTPNTVSMTATLMENHLTVETFFRLSTLDENSSLGASIAAIRAQRQLFRAFVNSIVPVQAGRAN